MTQEEAIRTLCAIDVPVGNCALIDEEAHEAISMAIEALSKPSLPSNLDDAAEEYMGTIRQFGDASFTLYADVDVKNGFKAGAEWMAEQGETVEGNIEGNWRNQENTPYEIYLTSDCLPKDTKFKFGDEVIVQIRKKQ